jgi:hypothetical protein
MTAAILVRDVTNPTNYPSYVSCLFRSLSEAEGLVSAT